MKILKTFLKIILGLISVPLIYFIIAIILTCIPVNTQNEIESNRKIYVTSNGVHLDIVIAVSDLSKELKEGLKLSTNTRYLSFGWGDKDFYLNTPEWSDLTFDNAFKALFLRSETLVHVSRYRNTQRSWKSVQISDHQLALVNEYIESYFLVNQGGQKSLLEGKGYTYTDDFYEARGNYSCFNTCNSWVNSGLKHANIKACLWTPFDFRIIELHTTD